LDDKLGCDVEEAWAQLAQKCFEELKPGQVRSVTWVMRLFGGFLGA
jgi:hypothetical protein